MSRRYCKMGLFLLLFCLCGTARPVLADTEMSTAGLAVGAALLQPYYMEVREKEAPVSESEAEETDSEEPEETSAPEAEEETESEEPEETSAPEAEEETESEEPEEVPAEKETAASEPEESEEEPEETQAPKAAEAEETESEEPEPEEKAAESSEEEPEDDPEESPAPEDGEEPEREDVTEASLTAARQTVVDSYENLGLVETNGGYLNVRSGAGTEYGIIGKMANHSACEILDSEEDWYRISSGSVEGYIAKDYVLTGEEAEQRALETMELKVQITTETLNVRTEPSGDADIWTQVDECERYTLVDNLGDWIEIEIDNDNTGFISSDYVTLKYTLEKAVAVEVVEEEEGSSLREQIIAYAMQYLGNPYVWGGESLTDGCDCSGFTMLVYRHFGVSLTHYSVSQSGEGRSISSSEMQPGDLIFYSGSDGTINHVTMYIGNGQVIGAQSTRAGIALRSWNYRTPVKIVNVLD